MQFTDVHQVRAYNISRLRHGVEQVHRFKWQMFGNTDAWGNCTQTLPVLHVCVSCTHLCCSCCTRPPRIALQATASKVVHSKRRDCRGGDGAAFKGVAVRQHRGAVCEQPVPEESRHTKGISGLPERAPDHVRQGQKVSPALSGNHLPLNL